MEYFSHTDFVPKAGDICLVDEADKLIFDQPSKFESLLASMPMICFTATTPDMDLEELEHDVLRKMGLQ